MSKKNFRLSAQFLQMIDLLLKFDCSSEEGNKSVFQSSWSSSKKHQSFVLHILLFLEKSKHPVPDKCPFLNEYPPLSCQSLSVVNYR